MKRALLLVALLAACGGRVSREVAGVPGGSQLAAPAEPNTEPCEICIDTAATYCGELDCRQGSFFCDLYGCFSCGTCANPDALCAHARCLP